MALLREHKGFEDALNIVAEIVSECTGIPGTGSVAIWGIKEILKELHIQTYKLTRVLNKKNAKAIGIPEDKYIFVFEQTKDALSSIHSVDYNPTVFRKEIFKRNCYYPTCIGAELFDSLHIEEDADILKAIRFVIAIYLLHWTEEADFPLGIFQELHTLRRELHATKSGVEKNAKDIANVKDENKGLNSRLKELEDVVKEPKRENDSIIIDREAIWKAGKKWYEQTQILGNRFSRLHINNEILPLVDNLPINVQAEGKKEQSLMGAIKGSSDHFYIIGEGGIGKTTALYSIMKAAYDNDGGSMDQIPIFIELARANSSTDFAGGKSKFILQSIIDLLQRTQGDSSGMEEQIDELFSLRNDKPEFFLLLDGFNEVARDEVEGELRTVMLSREIRYIIKSYSNVRVILTSRTKEALFDNKIVPLYLSGVKPKTIVKYLRDMKVSEKKIERIKQSNQLIELLRIPLFLTLYAEIKGEDELLTRGEILHTFFTQKRKNLYSERNRAEMINNDLESENSAIAGITPSMLGFLLDFIMPSIAWNMVRTERMFFYQHEIKELVNHVLTNVSDADVCGEFGKRCYGEYRVSSRTNTRTVANTLVRLFEQGDDEQWSNITARICECLNLRLGVIISVDFDRYEIVHQHIRDYFAALYHINKLKLSIYIYKQTGNVNIARSCLKELAKEPLPGQTLLFVGEALGEAHNIPVYDEKTDEWKYAVPTSIESDRNLIKRSLDIFRYRFGVKNDYSVWNLFQILKIVRNDLSGEDFSFLDLSKCKANGYRLGNKSFAAKVTGALITDNFFMPFGHSNDVNSANFNPSGDRIVTTSCDKTAKVWDTKSFEEIATLIGHSEEVLSAQYSADGSRILTTSRDNRVFIWDAYSFKPIGVLVGHIRAVNSAEYSPDGCVILTASDDGTIRIWDSDTKRILKTIRYNINKYRHIPDGPNEVLSAQFSSDGSKILAVCNDGSAKIWDANSFKRIGTIWRFLDNFRVATFSPDAKRVVTASEEGVAYVWNSITCDDIEIKRIKGRKARVSTVRYSVDGKCIVTGYEDGFISLWDAKTYKAICSVKGHEKAVLSIQYNANGRLMVTSSSDNSIKIWDSKTLEEIPGGVFPINKKETNSARYNFDGSKFITSSSDKTVKIWNANSYKCVGIIKNTDEVKDAQFSPDDNNILVPYPCSPIKVWNAKSLTMINEFCVDYGLLLSFSYSPNNKDIVTTSLEEKIKIWDAKSFKVKKTISTVNDESTTAVSCSPDGKNIVTAGFKHLRVRSTKSYNIITKSKLPNKDYLVRSIQFSPNSEMFVTVPLDGKAFLWSIKPLKMLASFSIDNERSIASKVSFSPDSEYLVVIFAERLAKVWNLKTMEVVALLQSKCRIVSVQYNPNGESILMASIDGTINIWDVASYSIIRSVHNYVGLDINNLDLRSINGKSCISDDLNKYLDEYGAITE